MKNKTSALVAGLLVALLVISVIGVTSAHAQSSTLSIPLHGRGPGFGFGFHGPGLDQVPFTQPTQSSGG